MTICSAPLLALYDCAWAMARPWLRRHKRLKDGFARRLVPADWGGRDTEQTPYDIWIQAASGGEAYLALDIIQAVFSTTELGQGPCDVILKKPTQEDSSAPGITTEPRAILTPTPGQMPLAQGTPNALGLPRIPHIFCSSCTRQGMDVLQQGLTALQKEHPEAPPLGLDYFPLDSPAAMRRALHHLFRRQPDSPLTHPPVLVLLETELWPGLLDACRRLNMRVLVLNGRMTEKSLRGYRPLRHFFRRRAPWRVLATSEADRLRFSALFDSKKEAAIARHLLRESDGELPRGNTGHQNTPQDAGPRCSIMPNIKFDRLARTMHDTPLDATPGPMLPTVTLASVREEEESALMPIMPQLLALHGRHNEPVALAVAPRHMHRVQAWIDAAQRMHLPYGLRSRRNALQAGSLLIWDTFGEMDALYAVSHAVFVGGSLAPLGGQNFLEPLAFGVTPCIGPHWSNFYWVGEALFTQGLARRTPTAAGLPRMMQSILADPRTRQNIQQDFIQYLTPRRGGSALAAHMIFYAMEP